MGRRVLVFGFQRPRLQPPLPSRWRRRRVRHALHGRRGVYVRSADGTLKTPLMRGGVRNGPVGEDG